MSQGVYPQWGIKQVRGGECVNITCQMALRLLHSLLASFFAFR